LCSSLAASFLMATGSTRPYAQCAKHPKNMSEKTHTSSGKLTAPHEDLTYRINGAAMAVHRRLGPSHKEEVFQKALEGEFAQIGLAFQAQRNLGVYDENRLLDYYIPDFIFDDRVIAEIKALSTLPSKYLGQVITYLNHTGLTIGLLINFGERSLRVRRVFPSPRAREFRIDHQWLWIPDSPKPPSV
jgi:GxxExxY protein